MKTIRLNESDIERLVNKIIKEDDITGPGEYGNLYMREIDNYQEMVDCCSSTKWNPAHPTKGERFFDMYYNIHGAFEVYFDSDTDQPIMICSGGNCFDRDDLNVDKNQMLSEEENNEWAICTKSVGVKDSKGKYKIPPHKEDEFKRCKAKVKKQFNEAVSGYDDPNLQRGHGEASMNMIKSAIIHIAQGSDILNKSKFDIVDPDLDHETQLFMNRLAPTLKRYMEAWKRAEKSRISRGR